MTTIGQRLTSEAWNFTWRVPYCGLATGVAGIFYASYVKLPVEKVAKAYAIAGAAAAVFECLINIVTDDPKKNAMLEVGVFSIVTTASIQKLRKMNLMGDILALSLITTYVVASYSILKEKKIIT